MVSWVQRREVQCENLPGVVCEQPQTVALRSQPTLCFPGMGGDPGSGSQAGWNLLSKPTLVDFLHGPITGPSPYHPLEGGGEGGVQQS